MTAIRDAAGSVALILAAADADGLPQPASAVATRSGRVFFNFSTVDDLNEWAAWSDVAVGQQWFTATQDEYRAQGDLMGVEVRLTSWAERVSS